MRTKYYAPLEFSDKQDARIYVLLIDEPRLIHTGGGQGYIVATFEADSNTFSSGVQSVIKDFSSNTGGGTNFTLDNDGDIETPCNIYVTMEDNDNFAITNLTDGGKVISITLLEKGQRILIDAENEDIQFSPRAEITFSGNVSDGELVVIQNSIYEFDTNSSVSSGNIPVDVSGNQTAGNAVTKLIDAINNDVTSEVAAYQGVGNSVVIFTKSAERDGENYSLSTTCANADWDDSHMTNIYLHNNWNGKVLTLRFGTNTINCMGKCQVEFKWEDKYLA